ncbi:ABC transporter substrate-binding protein [Pseudonocardia sp. DSM 110487]|uniref:ABC transporter substrate-binding protein n=1 Tax=Pseudonocardia sp. DSM 110487 TaxID=2865833 RepID=UPI001C6A895F|nr:ABC transporter substrate-binding protein [Pseudonocardia sp. DSM 110487]QYN39604.1 ABC transporter substrate-binding protein [Pseudonocardia sp. DSM 110487]
MSRSPRTDIRGRLTAVGAAVALTLMLAACGGSGGAATAGPVDAEPERGGTLTMAIGIPTRSFDPAQDATLSSTGDATRLAAVFDHLFFSDPVTGEAVPHIGESLEPSEDGRVWTMRIRPGVSFTDGTPYDAEAVRFTYRHYVDLDFSPEARTIATWDMSVIDPLTLQITSPEPNMHLDKMIAQSLPFIVSPTAMRTDPDGFFENPVGAGPYLLTEWVRDSHELYTANPNYWQDGKPYLEQVRINLVPEAAQRINTIASGQADMQPPSADSDLALFAQAEAMGLIVHRESQNGGGWIYFNNRRAPFDDVRAREAIYLSIDRQRLAEIMQGAPEARAAETLFVPGSPFHEPDLTFPATDRARAQELFDELAAEGKPVDFVFVNISGNDVNARAAQYIQSQLRDMRNVSIRIDNVDVTAARERVFLRHDYDMSPYPGSYRFPDPEPALVNLLRTSGSFNTTGYTDTDVDAALIAARSTSDTAERAADYRVVQERFMADLPGLFTFTPTLSTIMSRNVTGLEYSSRGLLRWDKIGFRP